jgi:aminoglycoside phosphotransferase (APT) family kinase protein
MHPDEFAVDAEVVRELVLEQYPQWAELRIDPVRPQGTDNALFRLGDQMVVRLPRRPRVRATLEKEARWLPMLAGRLPLEVPRPLAAGRPGRGYPFHWWVYTWLHGEPATPERIDDPERSAWDLADFVLALHRIETADGPPPGEHNFFRGAQLQARDGSTRQSIAVLGTRIDAARITRIWDEALAAPRWSGPGVWIHGDLDSRNVLARDRRVSAVIDWGGLGVGDPACDLMVAWKMVSQHLRDKFRGALAVDDASWVRARGWLVSQAVIALAYYTIDTNPTLVSEASRWLGEVIAER